MARTAVDSGTLDGGLGPPRGEQAWQDMREAPVVAAPPLRRSRGLIVLGVGLMAACGAGAVAVYDSATDLLPAVGVAARVPFGTTITEADFVQVQVYQDPAVRAVPWDERGQLVGQQAATDLLPGSVITAETVGGIAIPSPGQALVGVAVRPGHLPATSLAPRDKVLLVAAGAPAGGKDAAGAAIGGTVVLVGDVDVSGVRTVDVEVPSAQAGLWAVRAAAGQVAIVLQSRS